MPLFRRLSAELKRQHELVDLHLLYGKLGIQAPGKENTESLLKKIHKKGLKYSVERLDEVPRLNAGLSYVTANLWAESVAAYAYGLFNAAIATASLACEMRLRERLGFPKGRRTYGQILMGSGWKERKKWHEITYEDFAREFDDKIPNELWELHRKMVENYRNPYLHFDLTRLAQIRSIRVSSPPDFSKWYEGRPRLHEMEHAYYDRLALIVAESTPWKGSRECLGLAHSILSKHHEIEARSRFHAPRPGRKLNPSTKSSPI